MLRVLRIKNIAVARDVELELDGGFSVLTGETGAGKSILLDGLSLVLGDRVSKDMIRPGESEASVGAIFRGVDGAAHLLAEYGIEPDAEGEIEIRRTFDSEGRSAAKINGRNVSVTALREIGERLANINSQTENRSSAKKRDYLEMLDDFSDTGEALGRYSAAYRDYADALAGLEELKSSLSDRAMMTDIYTYQLREIDEVNLSDPDEEEKLEKQRAKLKDSERIVKYASLVMRALSRSEKGATAAYMIERAESAVDNLAGVIDGADEISARLRSIRFELIDIAEQVADVVEPDMENPGAKLDKIEDRLDKIAKLERKYGADIPSILKFREETAKKLDLLESGELALAEKEKEAVAAYEKARTIAREISKARADGAKKLSAAVAETLKYLDLPKARFEISVAPQYEADGSETLGASGFDDVTFLFTANPGYPLQELAKTASGGELSRTMLAIKCALSAKQNVPTLVFDEIDTGVSGATSERIGLKLKELSRSAQVVSVTHSPQVASLADAHYVIRKTETKTGAESTVKRLDEDERVAEIARIIGGVEVTSKQMQAAGEMIEKNLRGDKTETNE